MTSPTRPLRPREHGAYAMLAFPVLSGLAIGGVSVPGAAFAALVGVGFLAHEAVAVLLGTRGQRLRDGLAEHARRRLMVLAVAGVASAATFLATASPAALEAAWPTGALALGVGVLLLTGRTKSLVGELLVLAAFSSVHAVVATTGGSTRAGASLPVFVWGVSFALATVAVHALKARFKGGASGAWTIGAAPALAAIVLTVVVGVMARGVASPGVALATTPKAVMVLVLSGWAVHPRHLKRVGWGFVAADTVTLIVLAASLR